AGAGRASEEEPPRGPQPARGAPAPDGGPTSPTNNQPHPYRLALLSIAVLRDIPAACNRSTADHLISSHQLLFAAPARGG
ncbi:MAG: hypothetical protein WCF36_20010, partial [Candidatus Nanopelagicales bacterium]